MSSPRALLKHYGSEALHDELLRWEALRARVTHVRFVLPDDVAARTVIVFDGIPGAGKSTTLKWLQPALGAAWFSMARFAEAAGVTADQRREHQMRTLGAHPVDAQFIAAIAASDARFVVLEKFPRTVIEAKTMVEAANAHGWRLEVLHFALPGDCVERSTRRQIERGPRHGVAPTEAHARQRALTHLARATSSREALREAGVPIHAIDMTRGPAVNERAIRQALGVDPRALSWNLRPLQILANAMPSAWVSSGFVYRTFWNNRFGPQQTPGDIDVAIEREADEAPLLAALQSVAPEYRWSVLAPVPRLKQRYGIESTSVTDAKRFTLYLHRAGLVRWKDGAIDLHLPDGVEGALWSGRIVRNPRLADRPDEPHHAARARSDYPALDGGGPILTTWTALKRPRHPGRAPTGPRSALTTDQRLLAEQIVALHHPDRFRVEAPSRADEGIAGTFEHLAAHADDATFAAWVTEQRRHAPLGGRDPFLHSVLDQPHVDQSPMHQGWSLARHLAQTMIELRTDALLAFRLELRTAMLFHDTGKVASSNGHAQVSSALLNRFVPAWFPADHLALTKWLVRHHDLFGKVARGLTEKDASGLANEHHDVAAPASYPRAIDLHTAHARLGESGLSLELSIALLKQTWLADLGSIATLRWLRPSAELIERLLLSR